LNRRGYVVFPEPKRAYVNLLVYRHFDVVLERINGLRKCHLDLEDLIGIITKDEAVSDMKAPKEKFKFELLQKNIFTSGF